jgi:hypothetical protein
LSIASLRAACAGEAAMAMDATTNATRNPRPGELDALLQKLTFSTGRLHSI